MSGEELALYLGSQEEGELRLRPVARGREPVERMMKRLELKTLGRSVITRRGVQVGHLVRQPGDIKQIRKTHEQLKGDYQRLVAREDWPLEALLELVFLETPR